MDPETENEKNFIVRVVCQGKSMFVKFGGAELNPINFPEKGEF